MKISKSLILWTASLAVCIGLTAQAARAIHIKTDYIQTVSIVSWGTRGENVLSVQRRLRELGYYTGPLDGVFGTQTYEAILAYQQENGLTADGIAGADTLASLGIASGGSESSSLEQDIRLLASAIHGEGRGEPYEGQVAIGAVILNRVESDKFPNTVREVIYQNGAFDAVSDGQFYLTPNETAYRAAQDALNGWDPTDGALYYWNPATATSRWIWTVPISTQIGKHVFGTK